MSLVEQFHQMVSFVYLFFPVVLLATWATQMRKYTNAQIAVPASLIC